MVKIELIQCDNCKKDIGDKYSSYPHNTRYWRCLPVFSELNSFIYAVATKPDEPKDYCVKCFTRMIANLERDNG